MRYNQKCSLTDSAIKLFLHVKPSKSESYKKLYQNNLLNVWKLTDYSITFAVSN